MGGVAFWLKRSWSLAPILVVAQVVSLLNYTQNPDDPWPPWGADWSFMLSAWNGATILLSPVAAAIAAYMVHRQFPAAAREVASPLTGHARPALEIGTAVWLLGFGVQIVTLICGIVICAHSDAETWGLTMPGQLLPGLVALPAAVFLGVVVAWLIDSPWVVPGMGLGLFAEHRLLYWKNYPELFTLKTAGGASMESRPAQLHLLSSFGANLFFLVGALALIVAVTAPPGVRSRAAIAVAVLGFCGTLAIFLPWIVTNSHASYEYFTP